MQIENTVKIPATRYIELLERHIEMLEIKIKALTQPARLPACNLSEITKKIQASGQTAKAWAKSRGLNYSQVRKQCCGMIDNTHIRAALVEDGFTEV
jgi:hypothetical protein